MKKIITLLFILSIFTVVLVACGSNNNENNAVEENNTVDSNEETNALEENNEEVEDNEAAENNKDNLDEELDKREDHQEDLSFDEPGTVISGQAFENFKVEVRPVSIEVIDSYDSEEHGESEARTDILVKFIADIENTDDKSFELGKVQTPSFGAYDGENKDDIDRQAPRFSEEVTKDGESFSYDEALDPGETATVVLIFDTEDSEDFYLEYGAAFDQIVTYAQWHVKKSDFK